MAHGGNLVMWQGYYYIGKMNCFHEALIYSKTGSAAIEKINIYALSLGADEIY